LKALLRKGRGKMRRISYKTTSEKGMKGFDLQGMGGVLEAK
jgi:hypothetical protein